MRAANLPVVSLGALLLFGCSRPAHPADLDAGADARDVPVPRSEPGRHSVAVIDSRRVIPDPGLPAQAVPLASNNNLDVIRHDGRVYLAWRTAPDHFASTKAAIHVLSSTDERSWTYETSLTAGADLREPRFLSLGGKLLPYVARLGTDPLKFEPQGISWAVRAQSGAWSALADLGKPGFIAWRTRTERGTPVMLAYSGGEHIYDFSGLPLSIEMLTTHDGITWTGPVVSTGGGSETEGTLEAVPPQPTRTRQASARNRA